MTRIVGTLCCTDETNDISGDKRRGDKSCQIDTPPDMTQGKPRNVCLDIFDTTRLVKPTWVSDSCKMIGIRQIYAAILTGIATYPHLQNTAVMWCFFKRTHAWKKPTTTRNTSRIFFRIASQVRYLLHFPAKRGIKSTSGYEAHTCCSRESFSPNRKSLQYVPISVSCCAC